MNVHGHGQHHLKRPHHKRRSRKTRSTKRESEDSRAPQRSLRAGPQTSNSFQSDCELCAADVSDDEDSNAPLVKGSVWPIIRNHLHGSAKVAKAEKIHTQIPPVLSPSIDDADEIDSPAVNALRSLSFQKPRRSDSQGIRRMSTVLANTFHLFKANPAVSFAVAPSHHASKKAAEASRRSSAHSKSLVYRDLNRRRSTFENRNDDPQTLETPATITLRKPSNIGCLSLITTSMSASLACEPEYKRPADAPASELLAFYSSPISDKNPTFIDTPTPGSADMPESLEQQAANSRDEELQQSRRESKSVSSISEIQNARRFSTPAEATLTFADVHVAPGSFSVAPKSGELSTVPAEVSQRISTVQFRSRNSVHEIIWREDETTSDSSLTASSRASQKARHSFRSSSSPQSGESPTQKSAIEPKETKLLRATVPESVSLFMKKPENLFRWNWGQSPAPINGAAHAVGVKSDDVGRVEEEEGGIIGAADIRGDPLGRILVISTSSDSDPAPASLQQSSDQPGSRSRRPSSSDDLLSIHSFPPLPSRSSTADWQRAPLVDLNDPLAGRIAQYQTQTQESCIIPAARLVGSGVKMGKKGEALQLYGNGRRSSLPHGLVRFGLVSGVGSRIGVHSHRRISSKRRL